MIKIKNGKIDNIKDIIIYPPFHIFEATIVKSFIDILKERFNITIFGYDTNTSINCFENVKIITIPQKINFFKLIGIKKDLKNLKFDLSIDITDYNNIFSKIFNPERKISFLEEKKSDIFLKGDIIWNMNLVLGLLGENKKIKRIHTKRKNKGIYGIKTDLPKGWIEISKEEDIEKIGHLYTLKNEVAAKAYLKGIDVTLFLKDESDIFIPKDIKIHKIKSFDEVTKHIHEDTPHLI